MSRQDATATETTFPAAAEGTRESLLHRWAAGLDRASRLLHDFTARSEDAFVAFGSTLQASLEGAGNLAGTAASAVDAVSGNAIVTAMTRFREHTESLEGQARSGGELVEGMEQQLDNTLACLQELPGFHREFHRSVRSLRALGVATHIESARLGTEGNGFIPLAAHIKNLANQIGEKFASVIERSKHLEEELQQAGATVRAARTERQAETLEGIRRLANGLEELRRAHRRAQEASREIAVRSQQIQTAVAGILSSSQFQDITRQRLEHVRDSLTLLSARLRSGGEEGQLAEPEACALAHSLARLQSSQLREAQEEFSRAFDEILGSIHAVVSNLEALGDEVRRTDRETELSADSFLRGLEDDLTAVVTSVHRAAERNEEISRVLSGSAATAGEITAFVEDIDEIGMELELIAINAIVKSSRTGADGRPLAVIAQETQRQSVHARHATGQVSDRLRRIGDQAQGLKDAADSFTGSTREHSTRVAQDLEVLLRELRGADEEFRAQVGRLQAEGEHLTESLRAAARGATLHHSLAETAAEVERELAAVAEESRVAAPEGGVDDPEAVLEELAARYTMESQRDIHRVLGRSREEPPPGPTGQDELGDNVELF